MTESLIDYLARVEARCKQIESDLQAAEQIEAQLAQQRQYEQIVQVCEDLLQKHEIYPAKSQASVALRRIQTLYVEALERLVKLLTSQELWLTADRFSDKWAMLAADDAEAVAIREEVYRQIERINASRQEQEASRNKCEELQAQGSFEPCIRKSKEHLDRWPEDDEIKKIRLDAYLERAKALRGGNYFEDAFKLLTECKAYYPQDKLVFDRRLDVWLAWADQLKRQKSYQEAEQQIADCLLEYPDNERVEQAQRRLVKHIERIRSAKRTRAVVLGILVLALLSLVSYFWMQQDDTLQAMEVLGLRATRTATFTPTPTSTQTPTSTPTLTPTPTQTPSPTPTPSVFMFVKSDQWVYRDPGLQERSVSFLKKNSQVLVLCILEESAKVSFNDGSAQISGWVRLDQVEVSPNTVIPDWISRTADCP